MLHELIAALQGTTGSVFIDTENGIKVVKGLSFLHPAEENLLDRLCLLGTKYKAIDTFIENHKFCNSKNTGYIHGLYAQALVNGIDEILKPYRTAIWQLELDVLEDPYISLTYFLKLEEYLPLFDHLLHMITVLETDMPHGCRILEVVYDHSHSGISMIEICLQRLLACCHTVLFRQLKHWMVNGYLSDPFEEFFITSREMFGTTHNTSFETVKSDVKQENRKQYDLRPDMIPSYISTVIAAKILFVGESVGIFDPDVTVSAIRTQKPPSEFRKREGVFMEKFNELQECELFPLAKFTTVINELRSAAAEEMWKVIVQDCDLLSHLRIVKDFYLISRGELFLTFIDLADRFLSIPTTTTTARDVNLAFQASANQTLFDGDNIIQKFQVVLNLNRRDSQDLDKNSISKAKLETGWSTIGLIYEVPLPLRIFFTPKVLDSYNNVFRFLLFIRRSQAELHQCWTLQMFDKNRSRDADFVPFIQLRNHMSFLVDNFQFYLQVDVLESSFSVLEEKVKNVKDFEAIQEFHNYFLFSIASQCFLDLKPVYYCLMEILDICSSFCCLMKKAHEKWLEKKLGSSELAHLANFRLNFQRQTSLLFRVLCGVTSHRVGPHLTQLLLRIDFNKYLSSSGGHLGGHQEAGSLQK